MLSDTGLYVSRSSPKGEAARLSRESAHAGGAKTHPCKRRRLVRKLEMSGDIECPSIVWEHSNGRVHLFKGNCTGLIRVIMGGLLPIIVTASDGHGPDIIGQVWEVLFGYHWPIEFYIIVVCLISRFIKPRWVLSVLVVSVFYLVCGLTSVVLCVNQIVKYIPTMYFLKVKNNVAKNVDNSLSFVYINYGVVFLVSVWTTTWCAWWFFNYLRLWSCSLWFFNRGVKMLIQHFLVNSDLNGNNGEWTNGDDMEARRREQREALEDARRRARTQYHRRVGNCHKAKKGLHVEEKPVEGGPLTEEERLRALDRLEDEEADLKREDERLNREEYESTIVDEHIFVTKPFDLQQEAASQLLAYEKVLIQRRDGLNDRMFQARVGGVLMLPILDFIDRYVGVEFFIHAVRILGFLLFAMKCQQMAYMMEIDLNTVIVLNPIYYLYDKEAGCQDGFNMIRDLKYTHYYTVQVCGKVLDELENSLFPGVKSTPYTFNTIMFVARPKFHNLVSEVVLRNTVHKFLNNSNVAEIHNSRVVKDVAEVLKSEKDREALHKSFAKRPPDV